MAELQWGILATGAIARAFARDLATSRTGRLVAVGSKRHAASTHAFATSGRSTSSAHGSYDELLADPDVDAVYIATPHPMHAMWAVRAAEAGKHILCEKPLAMNLAEAAAIVDAAVAHDVFLMEAFMYRCHPQTDKLVELVRAGTIGAVRVIEAVHSFRGPTDQRSRLLANELGGGGILDVGCYCVSGANLVASVALGRDGANPLHVGGAAHLAGTGVDLWAVATLAYDDGILAHLACGVAVDQPPALRVHGDDGTIELRAPWLPTISGDMTTRIAIRRPGRDPEIVPVVADRGLYAYEADVVADAVGRGWRQAAAPAPTWADSLSAMGTLDRWRAAAGVVYRSETPAGLVTPIHGRPLTRRAAIATVELPRVGVAVSRVVLGGMVAQDAPTWPLAFSVFDEYFERGGTTFDTGFVYGQGETDKALGLWMARRGVRDDVVVIAKGAHTPHCDPASIFSQLAVSLDRLQTDRAEIYFMHRDNTAVPVGEFVDALDELQREGNIGAFGGSNWTAARIDEANAYAAANDKHGFTALSNQFSLARMITPTYPGTVGANEPDFRTWLSRTEMPVFAWSSQAAGFFAGLQPGGFLAHAWFDDDNVERRRRAEELAERRRTTPVTIALAWVLAQSLPIFPIVGPRSLAELRSTLAALQVTLAPAEVAWLDLEREGPT